MISTINGDYESNTGTETAPWNFGGDGVEIVDDSVTNAKVIAIEPGAPFLTPQNL